MGFLKNLINPNSNTLNENCEALCCVCRRKFDISNLYNCDYCGRWACISHVKKGPMGGKICEKCAK